MHNLSETKPSLLGYIERRHRKEDQVPGYKLGALVVKNGTSIEFKIGTGFTDEQRKDLWRKRHEIIGRTVTYKFFNHGIVDEPRHTVFKGFRLD